MSKNEVRSIDSPDGKLFYSLVRKNVKNINMRIRSDGTISISAPQRVPVSTIEKFIISKYEFIKSSINKLSEAEKKRMRLPDFNESFSEGDILPYLGDEYVLKIFHGEEDRISLEENIFALYTYDTENKKYISKLLRNWYYNRTEEIFKRINTEVYEKFRKAYDIPPAKIRIREMRSQWGSCHISDEIIVMNSKLIFFPENSVRYVFIHEYAHFIVPNHSGEFYETVQKFMPDHKFWSGKLK